MVYVNKQSFSLSRHYLIQEKCKPGLRRPPEGPPGNQPILHGSGKLSSNLDSTAFRMTASSACPKVSAWPVMGDFSFGHSSQESEAMGMWERQRHEPH